MLECVRARARLRPRGRASLAEEGLRPSLEMASVMCERCGGLCALSITMLKLRNTGTANQLRGAAISTSNVFEWSTIS